MSRLPRKVIKVKGVCKELARYNMEKFLNRKLASNEWVHHKDGNTLNDSIENLEIISPQAHVRQHIDKGDYKPFNGIGGGYLRRISPNADEAWCSRCKMFLPKSMFSISSFRWNNLQTYCKKCNSARHREKQTNENMAG